MNAFKFLRAAIIFFGILLSACAPSVNPTAPANVGGGKSLTDITFTGVIESMNGDEWVISGQTVKIDESVLRDGTFLVGDTVKVEASVAEDGSVVAQRLELPTGTDLAQATSTSPDDSASTPQALVFDDSGSEAVGTVDAITDTSLTIGGQTYTFAPGAEIKGVIVPGAVVKVHFVVNADGTLSIREVELADPTQTTGDNSNDDNSNATNANDDNSNDDNGNDSNSNDDNGNDDSNDDNSNNGGSDDNGGGNSNDDGDDDSSDDNNND